jgi:hypothetical protein
VTTPIDFGVNLSLLRFDLACKLGSVVDDEVVASNAASLFLTLMLILAQSRPK